MAKKNKLTVFQTLERALRGNFTSDQGIQPHINSYDMSGANSILYKTTDKDDYERTKLELQQNAYLKERWLKANIDLSVSAFAGLTNIKLMYRDADLMDSFPEIGAALDIVAEESVLPGEKGQIINVYSKSDRIKAILEDLFVNRLNLQVTAPMIIRGMCKYGNQFMMLDIDNKLGIKGWRQLPVFNVERLENGIQNPYGSGQSLAVNNKEYDSDDFSTKFVWIDENNSQVPFRDWQIAHFRLLTNSMCLPYGCLVGDTRIETEFGYKEMSNIKIGDKVWTFNIKSQEKELSDVTIFMPKGEKDVYGVSTFHNYIEGTEDHKLLTYSNNDFVYKEIKDIKIGDLLIIDNSCSKNNKLVKIDKSYPTEKEANLKKTMIWWDNFINYIPDYIDEDFAKFFGFMVGDGWITQNKYVYFATGEYEKFNLEFAKYVSKITNHNYRFVKPFNYEQHNYEYSSCVIPSKCLALVLRRMGFVDGFDKKRIPSWVFESGDGVKKAFLNGLMISDGSYNIDKYGVLRCSIEMANEQLIKDIKTLVQSLGYKSSKVNSRNRVGKSTKLKNGRSIISKNTSYYLYFYESFNIQEKKYDLTNRLNDGFKTEKVRKIEYIGKKETYDFTVANNNSNFFANGIVTHNCSYLNAARRHWRMLSLMEDMMLIYRLERSIERRVYKIYVGAIDDADVQAYVEQIANNFKRTPIIDPMTGQVDLRKNILPVHKDTPIPLLDGRTITISELAKEFENGKENYVYSIQDKTHKIVPGRVIWCGKNYTAEKLYKITLDDDSHMILAGEHEIIMRDGSKKRADEISIGESVMPLYRKMESYSNNYKADYERVYNPNSGKYEFTHRIIAEELEKDDNCNVIHHSNFNRYDNTPNNLKWMTWDEHRKLHCRMKEVLSERITKYNVSDAGKVERKLRGIKLGYRDEFKKYNESELHKQHNEIRRFANIEKWKNSEKRKNAISNMTVKFDDFVWNEIRKNILNGRINSQNNLIDYVNSNLIDYLLSINTSKKLQHYKKVSKSLVKARITDNGFESFFQYYESVKKNHKITSIEIIGGDDVYCMTVVGLNGEEDRHNFALTTCKSDGSLNESGVFVSNCVDQDIFIPVRDQNAPTPIDTLSAAQNLTAMDDIKFVQNKVLTALRIPKSFLNFEENAGDGKNLALMDIRFTRVINRIQQSFLMELTKAASIHLYLLGFDDDLTNFNLTMNNPSTQAEQLEIDNLQKKITAVRDAVSDPGNGLPVMSQTRALKQIMKWSDREIKENLEEIRLEKGIAAELEKTTQIIKRTGIFDIVDRMYGEPGAEYQEDMQQGGPEGGMGGGMPGGGGGSFGSDLDNLGAPGGDENGEITGAEGSEPTGDMEGGNNAGTPPPPTPPPSNESISKNKKLIAENTLKESNRKLDSMFKQYINKIDESIERSTKHESIVERTDIYDKSLLINEEFSKMIDSLNILNNEEETDE